MIKILFIYLMITIHLQSVGAIRTHNYQELHKDEMLCFPTGSRSNKPPFCASPAYLKLPYGLLRRYTLQSQS